MAVVKRRGKWTLDYYDQHGKRRWETTQGNKKEAEKLMADRLLEIGHGDYLPPSEKKVPFSEFAHQWLTGREGKIRPITIEQYRDHINRHLIPFLGSILVGRIDIPLVEAYINRKDKERKEAEATQAKAKVEDRELTPEEQAEIKGVIGLATINKTLVTLGSILKYAVIRKLLNANPVSLVERLKPGAQEYSVEKEPAHFLNPEQVRSLLSEASPGLYRTLLTTAVVSGLRQEELLGLSWGHIDWVSGQIQVRRVLSRTEGQWKFYPPKSKASRRNVDVDPALLLVLKKWRLQVGKNELDDLVFPSPTGGPLYRTILYRQGFMPAMRRSGVPRIRFHDLRHTYASLLIDQGEHPKYIQTQMGHASIKVTMDVYGHLMDEVNTKSASKLAKTILGDGIEGNSSKSVAR